MILQLFLHICLAVGIADCLTQEYVFQWFRDWVSRTFPYDTAFSVTLKTFVNCPICQSFWASLAVVWFFPLLVEWWFVCPFICLITAKLLFQKVLVY